MSNHLAWVAGASGSIGGATALLRLFLWAPFFWVGPNQVFDFMEN